MLGNQVDDDTAAALIQDCTNRARVLVRENWLAICAVAEALMERRSLVQEEVEAIAGGKSLET